MSVLQNIHESAGTVAGWSVSAASIGAGVASSLGIISQGLGILSILIGIAVGLFTLRYQRLRGNLIQLEIDKHIMEQNALKEKVSIAIGEVDPPHK